jgi:hypothetical protein
MLIEGLEDFVAWLKGPPPLEQEREKIRAIEEKRKACAKELGLLPNQAGLSDAVEQVSQAWVNPSQDRADEEVEQFLTEEDRRRHRNSRLQDDLKLVNSHPCSPKRRAKTGEVDELFEDRLRQYGHIC